MGHETINGGCYCGAIRYEAEPPAKSEAICFCTNCRKAAGAQSVAWITVPKTRFRFVSGSPTTFRTDTQADRTHCDRCGTSMTYCADARPNDMDITTGSLDNPEAYPPKKAVYAQSRLSWDENLRS